LHKIFYAKGMPEFRECVIYLFIILKLLNFVKTLLFSINFGDSENNIYFEEIFKPASQIQNNTN